MQAYIVFSSHSRNFAIADHANNILTTSSENSRLHYLPEFVKCLHCNKNSEKQSDPGRSKNWATMTRRLNSLTYSVLHVVSAFLQMQYWLATRLSCGMKSEMECLGLRLPHFFLSVYGSRYLIVAVTTVYTGASQ